MYHLVIYRTVCSHPVSKIPIVQANDRFQQEIVLCLPRKIHPGGMEMGFRITQQTLDRDVDCSPAIWQAKPFWAQEWGIGCLV